MCLLVHLFKMLLAYKWTYGLTEGAGINPYNNISKGSYLSSVDKKKKNEYSLNWMEPDKGVWT